MRIYVLDTHKIIIDKINKVPGLLLYLSGKAPNWNAELLKKSSLKVYNYFILCFNSSRTELAWSLP